MKPSSEADRATLRLGESEAARLWPQFERMPIACIVFDAQVRITEWNPAAEAIFGYRREEVLGREGPLVLLSPAGTLRQGRNAFTIEFRRTGTNTLVDVGTVRASANMTMPGMVMSGGLQVTPTGVAGRYAATAEFGMAGAWQMAIEWDGPTGKGSVNFEGGVQ